MDKLDLLAPEDRARVTQELEWLARARSAIRAAPSQPRPLGVKDSLRELRQEAAEAHPDDLAPLLHDLAVRQTLTRRSAEPRPSLDVPYFAHLVLQEGHLTKDYFLGTASLLEGTLRIVDWRVAPVARIFYQYREGDEFEEEFPGRVAEGRVLARRVLVFEEGELTQILGDDGGLFRDADRRWQRRASAALAEGGAGTAFRPGELGIGVGTTDSSGRPAVTALLDAEQLAAIHAPSGRSLLVLGSAGSGKTTVALHRLAVLVGRRELALEESRVVVPGPGLARLARRLLEPLGVGAAQVSTLDAWAQGLARQVFGEDLPPVNLDAPAMVVSMKRHPALHDELRKRFASRRAERPTLRSLRRRLAVLLSDREFLDGVWEAAGGSLPRGCVDETIRHTMRQGDEDPSRELRAITDRQRLRTLDGKGVLDDTPEALAGTIDVEDLPILLALRASIQGLPAPRMAHLVLDEGEDFSLFELEALGHLVGDTGSATVAGDEAQQTQSSFAGWTRSLEALGVRGVERTRLAVSYRCPRPIAELAGRVLGPLAPPEPARIAREGVPVERLVFPRSEPAYLCLMGLLDDLLSREPRASVGVLFRERTGALKVFGSLASRQDIRLVLDGEFSFRPGVDVCEIEAAKGLEFDYVVVADASAEAYPENDEARRALHVAVTRASHQLLLLSPGPLSPLLRDR